MIFCVIIKNKNMHSKLVKMASPKKIKILNCWSVCSEKSNEIYGHFQGKSNILPCSMGACTNHVDKRRGRGGCSDDHNT